MHKAYEILYSEMLQDIEKAWQHAEPDREKSDTCFWIAHDYWNRLKKMVRSIDFENDQDEIDFFRVTKPLFSAYIEYYVLLSESLMFVPDDPAAELIFWDEEQKRYDRFTAKHKTFIDYYEQGQTKKDKIFFLRKNYHQENPKTFNYDNDLDLSTGYDQVLGTFLAFKKYLEYITCRKLLLQ